MSKSSKIGLRKKCWRLRERVIRKHQLDTIAFHFDDYMAFATCIWTNLFVWLYIYPKLLRYYCQ